MSVRNQGSKVMAYKSDGYKVEGYNEKVDGDGPYLEDFDPYVKFAYAGDPHAAAPPEEEEEEEELPEGFNSEDSGQPEIEFS